MDSLPMDNSENQNQLLEEKKTKSDSSNNLPEDIVQSIFTFLPIKNAIVTASTVSRRYKRSWRHNRKFLFGRDFYLQYRLLGMTSIVDHLFNCHKGNEIKTFQLHIDPIGIEGLINRWLQICIQKDIEDLELHLYRFGFTVEFCVFNTLHKLKTLKLIQCVIQLPEVPIGLQFLQTLSLCNIHVSENMIDMLIGHCKMLNSVDLICCFTIKKLNLIARENKHFEKLRIIGCRDLENIEINSPTLRSIFYHGKFLTIRIVQGMQLYEALFQFTPSKNYMWCAELEALVKELYHVSILTTTPQLIEVYIFILLWSVFSSLLFYLILYKL